MNESTAAAETIKSHIIDIGGKWIFARNPEFFRSFCSYIKMMPNFPVMSDVEIICFAAEFVKSREILAYHQRGIEAVRTEELERARVRRTMESARAWAIQDPAAAPAAAQPAPAAAPEQPAEPVGKIGKRWTEAEKNEMRQQRADGWNDGRIAEHWNFKRQNVARLIGSQSANKATANTPKR